VSVGDLVQWESDGAVRLETPKRVRAIQEHAGQRWVFIEGSETGIPMDKQASLDQVRVEQKGAGSAAGAVTPPVLPEDKRPQPGMKEEGEAI
jgi:hypothetical protein